MCVRACHFSYKAETVKLFDCHIAHSGSRIAQRVKTISRLTKSHSKGTRNKGCAKHLRDRQKAFRHLIDSCFGFVKRLLINQTFKADRKLF